MSEDQDFAAGDVVRVRATEDLSEGVPMTVEKILHIDDVTPTLECVWFEDGDFKRKSFAGTDLELCTTEKPRPFPTLTRRERAVALQLAVGERNADIAKQLGVSIKTVDTHRSHVLKKLSCRNNVDLARLAIREGYVQP